MCPTRALVNVIAVAPVAGESLGTVAFVRSGCIPTVIATPTCVHPCISTLVNVITLSMLIHPKSTLALTEKTAVCVDAHLILIVALLLVNGLLN